MKIPHVFIFALFITIFIFPFALSSADIYENIKGEAKIIGSLNNHIILGNRNLNSTFIIVKSNKNYTDFQIESSCYNNQELIYKDINSLKFNLFLIKINFITNFCENNNIFLTSSGQIYADTKNRIPIYTEGKTLDKLLDYSNTDVQEKIQINDKDIATIETEIKETNKNDILQRMKLVNKTYKSAYYKYESNLLKTILEQRKNLTYIIPISGKDLPTKMSLMPNAKRPYRAKYTDGIHHGWDIFTSKGTPVHAIGNGVIIRVKDNFVWGDFNKILWENLTDLGRATNLDIYRGNQIWLKTMDGNIIFYSHLNNIAKDIYEGKIINEGDILGFVGKSGVPDKGYNGYHLHFEIQINPFIRDKEYSFLDIMTWNWFGKGKSNDWILAEQNKKFKN